MSARTLRPVPMHLEIRQVCADKTARGQSRQLKPARIFLAREAGCGPDPEFRLLANQGFASAEFALRGRIDWFFLSPETTPTAHMKLQLLPAKDSRAHGESAGQRHRLERRHAIWLGETSASTSRPSPGSSGKWRLR